MSTKWLVVWLIILALLAAATGYLLINFRNEQQNAMLSQNAPSLDIKDIRALVSKESFDFTKDDVTATVISKGQDDDGEAVLELYFSWPPASPLWDQTAVVGVRCTLSLSSLSTFRIGDLQEDQKDRGETELSVNIYATAQEGDVLTAKCLNNFCTVLGGGCNLKRKI